MRLSILSKVLDLTSAKDVVMFCHSAGRRMQIWVHSIDKDLIIDPPFEQKNSRHLSLPFLHDNGEVGYSNAVVYGFDWIPFDRVDVEFTEDAMRINAKNRKAVIPWASIAQVFLYSDKRVPSAMLSFTYDDVQRGKVRRESYLFEQLMKKDVSYASETRESGQSL